MLNTPLKIKMVVWMHPASLTQSKSKENGTDLLFYSWPRIFFHFSRLSKII